MKSKVKILKMAAKDGKISSDLIQQYVNITGSDEESALHLLEAFNGDLESAVNMYLEGGGQLHSSTKTSKPKSSSSSGSAAANDAIIVDDDLNRPSSSNRYRYLFISGHIAVAIICLQS